MPPSTPTGASIMEFLRDTLGDTLKNSMIDALEVIDALDLWVR